MDNSKKFDNPSPSLRANPISKLTFWWLTPFFSYGKNHDVETKDLHNCKPNDHSKLLGDRLELHWIDELKLAKEQNRKPKLLNAIRRTFFLSYAYWGGWILFLSAVLRVLQPFTLGLLIAQFDPQTADRSHDKAYFYATGVVVMAILMALIGHHSNLGQYEVGMRIRIACCALIYRKILRLSRSAAGKTAGGQVVNLLSNDVSRFDAVGLYLHYIWIMPIQCSLITYLIWRSVGAAVLAGVVLITLQTIPLQGYLSKWTSKLRMKIAIRTDERVRLMSEIISGIQVIKMYAWEKPFEKLVAMARSYEVDVLTLTSYLRGFSLATMVFTERTTLFVTIMVYVLCGNKISAGIVFSMAQYFNILQCTMAIYFPMAVTALAEALVSVKRLQNFLLLEENIPAIHPPPDKDEKSGFAVQGVTASWNENSITNTLHKINIRVQRGKLCALVGPVGAGKSSFLQLVLGELKPSHGHVYVGGTVSFASQEAWLFAGTVRNNILFGQPYDKEKYKEVTKACALLKDFEQFPQGDKTYVGDKGASLSGGQRARINLARAVYRDADVYLLDDPLSAVDTHVGKHLFDECINNYLSNKTRILVTHQIQYLKDADVIVVLNNGQVENQGTFAELQKSQLDFANLISTDDTEERPTLGDIPVRKHLLSEVSHAPSSIVDEEDEEEEPQETAELMAKGKMASSLYLKYFQAGGSYYMLALVVFSLLLGQLASSGTDYWVGFWTRQGEKQQKQYNASQPMMNSTTNLTTTNQMMNTSSVTNTTEEPFLNDNTQGFDDSTALWIYGACITGSVVFTTIRSLLFYKVCMTASRGLHNTMFASILKAPMRFFNTNPSGRILNRFSKDIGAVDEVLPRTMIDSIQIFLVMSGILTQVAIINWWMIFPMMIMGFAFYKIQTVYLATAQDIKRLEGTTKSPVFSHVSSSLLGLATIRSSDAEEMVRKDFDSYQDVHTSAYYMTIAASTAFGLWLDAVSVTFVSFVTYSFIILDDEKTFAGNVGLALSQVLILCGMLQHGIRQTSDMIAQMTSVERVLQFTKIEKEGPFESDPGQKPPATWPAKGQIRFDHMSMSYSDVDPPVLKDLNFLIKPGMKVGVVGRTGAGKSSLISALFRLADLEGMVFLDDVDTKKIGLHDLRSKISIIPQEPMLFSAKLRDNLDPFQKYDDATLWSALDDVELKASVSSLDDLVNEGGSNFSAGQRQLLCLARAIVRNNKVLVLDEATANVDPTTDHLIQLTIRNKFKDCTVITIAHRLNTIMDSDAVLVMERGQMVEFDHPHTLLQKENGYFTNMVKQTGKAMTEQLRSIAKEAYDSIPQEIVPTHCTNGNVKTD